MIQYRLEYLHRHRLYYRSSSHWMYFHANTEYLFVIIIRILATFPDLIYKIFWYHVVLVVFARVRLAFDKMVHDVGVKQITLHN